MMAWRTRRCWEEDVLRWLGIVERKWQQAKLHLFEGEGKRKWGNSTTVEERELLTLQCKWLSRQRERLLLESLFPCKVKPMFCTAHLHVSYVGDEDSVKRKNERDSSSKSKTDEKETDTLCFSHHHTHQTSAIMKLVFLLHMLSHQILSQVTCMQSDLEPNQG